MPLLGLRKPDGLAAERIVLAERVAFPVVRHQDPQEIRVPFDRDPEHVPSFALVPVGRRPDADHARDGFTLVEPDLHAHARRALAHREQVVVDREALRLRRGQPLVTLRHRRVQVAPGRRPDVAGDAVAAPAQVIGRGDVREHVEAGLVPEVRARVDQRLRSDDERGLAVRLGALEEPRHVAEVQDATPRISYAGGTPARIFSWSRTIPSISASGRGGQPGTWMSTATILSTPWSTV